MSEVSFFKRMHTKEHQQLVSERVELKAKGIGTIAVAGQPVRVKIALKFFDPILALSSVVVAVKDDFGSARTVGNDKAQVGAERTDFDFDHNFSLFGPASRSMSKAIKNSDRFVVPGILTFGPLEPALGLFLEDGIGAHADSIEHVERFQGRVDRWSSRAGIGAVAELGFRETPLKDRNQAFKLNGDAL